MPRPFSINSSSASRSASRSERSRPYKNPYMDMDYEELASVLGESEGDDRVRNIIYGSMAGSSVSFMVSVCVCVCVEHNMTDRQAVC